MLKDLSADGFYAPRTPRDNLEDTKQIIERLAQFHAASFYLTETVGGSFSTQWMFKYSYKPFRASKTSAITITRFTNQKRSLNHFSKTLCWHLKRLSARGRIVSSSSRNSTTYSSISVKSDASVTFPTSPAKATMCWITAISTWEIFSWKTTRRSDLKAFAS